MKRKLIPIFCIVATSVVAVNAQTAQAPPKTPPPSASSGIVRIADPSPEVQRLAAQIAAYATAQCAGKGADIASDCRVKALWIATQCPDRMIASSSEIKTASSNCAAHQPGFEYDISSIKPRKNEGDTWMTLGPTSDGYRATNVEMISLVSIAFPVGPHAQFTGEPAWTGELRFDVEAKFEPEVGEALMKLNRDDRGLVQTYMLQKLLKERMNLALHIETKEVPAYDLIVGKNGPKMKVAEPSRDGTGGRMIPRINQGRMVFDIIRYPMSAFAVNLSGPAGRPVFDKTGLTGSYDFKLEYVREQDLATNALADGATSSAVVAPPDPAGPTLQAALEDQLGLKLVPSRGLMQILVIDHIDKPDAN